MRVSAIPQYRVDGQGNRIAEAHSTAGRIVEYIPPTKISGLAELNRRKLALPAVTILLESMRRRKTKQRALTLSAVQREALGLSRKQCRVATESLKTKASDLVTVSQSGHEAAKVSITEAGWKLLATQ